MYDVIIVGGGPAGLQAALTLGRMHKHALLLDSGAYRNGRVAHMHNFLTHDGTPPEKFRSEARAELAAYPTVEIRDAAVGAVEKVGDTFRVALGEEVLESRLVILATGVRDEMPAVPGLEDLWGTHAYACPFCHGHELSGRPIGILAGPAALHLVGLLAPIGSSVTVFSQGAELDAEQLAMLDRLGAVLRPEPVVGVSHAPEADEVAIALADRTVNVAGLFVGTGRFVQSAPFADQLGLDLLDSGCIAIDDFGRTSLDGVFAAGDLAHRPAFPMPMASVLNAAAAGQLAAVASVQQLLAAPPQK
ncbi:thioredoxin reductase [Nocardioides daedukensis]|uniref:Thioredoxin reductase n=1 Tax=Nocardioides daedukensis TaxID=634462 RepID=A0A7Y9S0F3_9ACTN|nr:NAD(P)/FAD-dependent oxidoreductase [Nocardioides daedukensis]NYG58861.1 thioredoxin reductase [Nocardioides daedukensis]